jgi:hypothetical protein
MTIQSVVAKLSSQWRGRRISEGGLDGFGRVDYPVVETAADQANLSGETAAGLFAVAERSIVRALDLLLSIGARGIRRGVRVRRLRLWRAGAVAGATALGLLGQTQSPR